MSRFAPGSLPWLLTWELRLALRGTAARFGARQGTSRLRLLLAPVFLLVLAHWFGWAVVSIASHGKVPPARFLPGVSVFLLGALLSGTGAALAASVSQVFLRGDLDLINASPILPRRVFTARSLSIAVQAMAVPAFFLLPVANMGVLLGRGLRWLAPYPVVLSLGLVAAALGMGITVLLVRWLGPKRARIAALVLSTVFGAALLVVFQLPALIGNRWLKPQRAIDAADLVWLPTRALFGEPAAIGACLAVAGLLFGLAAWTLPRSFAYALGSAAGVASGGKAARSAAPRAFRSSLWQLMFAKEWHLILRDPQLLVLFGQLLLGFAPALVLLASGAAGHSPMQQAGLAGVITLVTCVTADTMIWLAISAEDMPELLACAPHPRGALRRIKLRVMLLPLWLPCLALAALVAWPDPALFGAMAAGIAGGSLSLGFFHLWLPNPGSRKDVRLRYQRAGGSLGRRLVAFFMQFGWAGFAAVLAGPYPLAALLVLPFALAGPFYAWLGRNDGDVLSY